MSDVSTLLSVLQLIALIAVPVYVVTSLRGKADQLTKAIDRLTKKVDRLDSRVDQHAVDIAVLQAVKPNELERPPIPAETTH